MFVSASSLPFPPWLSPLTNTNNDVYCLDTFYGMIPAKASPRYIRVLHQHSFTVLLCSQPFKNTCNRFFFIAAEFTMLLHALCSTCKFGLGYFHIIHAKMTNKPQMKLRKNVWLFFSSQMSVSRWSNKNSDLSNIGWLCFSTWQL